jgi:hypothetical protein
MKRFEVIIRFLATIFATALMLGVCYTKIILGKQPDTFDLFLIIILVLINKKDKDIFEENK